MVQCLRKSRKALAFWYAFVNGLFLIKSIAMQPIKRRCIENSIHRSLPKSLNPVKPHFTARTARNPSGYF
ncbi:hypothetical protein INT82_08630 [Mannheimia haemolytica]|nr:hypothetical protein [Mannheimia haemolytica]